MTEIGRQNTGFSIVEAMVSVFILMTTLAVGLSLFSFTSKNTRKVEVAQNQHDAIEADIASILRANDRYQCTAPSDESCDLAPTDPDENSYLPASTASSKNWISTKCKTGFGPALAEAINSLDQPDNKEIQRIASADAANTHLYKVEWKAGTQTIRSLTLYPSVAAWCP